MTGFDLTGSILEYSTFLGGTPDASSYSGSYIGDGGNAVALDAAGDAYMTGPSQSSGLPVTADAFQKSNKALKNGATNAFFTELNPKGTALVYSTYFGGAGLPSNAYQSGYLPGGYGDTGTGIVVDGRETSFYPGPPKPGTSSQHQRHSRNPIGEKEPRSALTTPGNPKRPTKQDRAV